jgi:hypothetical protein
MEELLIYKYQAESIKEALRLVANLHNSKSAKTCFDRNVIQAQRMIENVLNGEPDKFATRFMEPS